MPVVKKLRIPNFGYPLSYIGKTFKLLSEKAKLRLQIDYNKCQILGVVQRVEDESPLFKLCDAAVSNPTKDQIKYCSCKVIMSTDKKKNGK